MAYPNLTLIGALRQAAQNLRGGAPYAWGNHGAMVGSEVVNRYRAVTVE